MIFRVTKRLRGLVLIALLVSLLPESWCCAPALTMLAACPGCTQVIPVAKRSCCQKSEESAPGHQSLPLSSPLRKCCSHRHPAEVKPAFELTAPHELMVLFSEPVSREDTREGSLVSSKTPRVHEAGPPINLLNCVWLC